MAQYVDHGSLMVPAAPFISAGTKLWGFIAEADGDKLDAWCQRVFTEPSGGAIDVLALGHRVMITWGVIDSVSSQARVYDVMGGLGEPQCVIWVPAAIVDRRGDDRIVATRFLMTVPYIWVDNAMSLATGRELFGHPKAWGELTFPGEGAAVRRWAVNPFGLDFGPTSKAHISSAPVLEVVEGDALEGDGDDPWFEGLIDIAHDIADRFFEKSDDERVVPGLRLAADLAVDLLNKRFQQIFLKQIRGVEDGTQAALQQVVESTYEVLKVRGRPRLREYALTVREMDSHPVTAELGLHTQTLNLGYEVEMDFTVGGGKVLWDAAAP